MGSALINLKTPRGVGVGSVATAEKRYCEGHLLRGEAAAILRPIYVVPTEPPIRPLPIFRTARGVKIFV